MCGRYVATTPAGVLAEYFAVDEVRNEPEGPSWNVAPTDPVPAVVVRREQRLLGLFRWGLVPSWATDRSGAARMINARAETLRTKPAYRAAFARRRCLLPADGFYEWERRADGSKRAWFIHRADSAPMAMAGLWEVWRDGSGEGGGGAVGAGGKGGELVRTCAVVTTGPNSLMAPIHDRMPALLEPARWDTWLDPANDDIEELAQLLVPADPRLLERYPVTALVNSVRNNGPELLEPDATVGSS